jgi:hypothetical protein
MERATLPAAMAWQDSSTELAGSCSVTLLFLPPLVATLRIASAIHARHVSPSPS